MFTRFIGILTLSSVGLFNVANAGPCPSYGCGEPYWIAAIEVSFSTDTKANELSQATWYSNVKKLKLECAVEYRKPTMDLNPEILFYLLKKGELESLSPVTSIPLELPITGVTATVRGSSVEKAKGCAQQIIIEALKINQDAVYDTLYTGKGPQL